MKVAILTPVYWPNCSAHWMTRKILRGWREDGGAGPDMELVAVALGDEAYRSVAEGACRGIPVVSTIAEATLSGLALAVDGILLCCGQGRFERNGKGQHLLPHAAYWHEIQQSFFLGGAVCPVFSANLIASTWDDAKLICDRAQTYSIPLLSGSCYPLSYRDNDLPVGATVSQAVAISSSHAGNREDFEHFAKHSLESLQCQLERRAGGETGVVAVACFAGSDLWQKFDQRSGPKSALESTLSRLPQTKGGDYRAATAANPQAAVIAIEYADGTRAAVLQADGFNDAKFERDIILAIQTGAGPVRIRNHVDPGFPELHYAAQLKAVEQFFQTGVSPVPVERTLLCNGILDAAMRSRAAGGARVTTPELAIAYAAPKELPAFLDEISK